MEGHDRRYALIYVGRLRPAASPGAHLRSPVSSPRSIWRSGAGVRVRRRNLRPRSRPARMPASSRRREARGIRSKDSAANHQRQHWRCRDDGEMVRVWWLPGGHLAVVDSHGTKASMPRIVRGGTLARLTRSPRRRGRGSRRHGEADRLRGGEIDHQLEFRWLLHWQIGRFSAIEDFPVVSAELAIGLRRRWPDLGAIHLAALWPARLCRQALQTRNGSCPSPSPFCGWPAPCGRCCIPVVAGRRLHRCLRAAARSSC